VGSGAFHGSISGLFAHTRWVWGLGDMGDQCLNPARVDSKHVVRTTVVFFAERSCEAVGRRSEEGCRRTGR